MVAPQKKLRIGNVLLEAGLITDEQLKKAVETQRTEGGKLGDVIINMGFVKEIDFLRALSNQLHMPFIELEHYTVKPELVRKLPEKIARRFRVIILDCIANQYLVGMADPTDVIAHDEVGNILNASIRTAIVRESDLLKIIDLVYRRTEDIASFAAELKEELTKEDVSIIEEADEEVVGADSAPVAKLLDSIFEDAVQVGASDIHIEPDKGVLRIRQRIDGILHEETIEGKQINDALVLRIKLIAKLNISEKRLPQDGRFRMRIKERDIDVRVSTMPIRHGESVVMRLLDQSQGMLSLKDIDMLPAAKQLIEFNINRPNGLILVTGPTGSGKTTTLYSVLNELNDKTKKIITIEDPVEYTLPRVNQVQVNPIIGLTFAKVLRTALRQDPEVVMIGEMRDEETATIGLRAAMTGHLVLSTLHTNDAISSAMRLVDMGAESYLVAAALRLIVAQRLIRKVCETCEEEYQPTNQDKDLLKRIVGKYDSQWKFKYGKGCSKCNETGYYGRLAVHEILEMNSDLADLLREGDAVKFAKAAKSSKTYQPLAVCAFEHAKDGVSSLDEVFRLASEIEETEKFEEDSK